MPPPGSKRRRHDLPGSRPQPTRCKASSGWRYTAKIGGRGRCSGEMLKLKSFSGSMTTDGEIRYSRALHWKLRQTLGSDGGLRLDTRADGNYWGGLASDKLNAGGNRVKRTAQIRSKASDDYPLVFRSESQYAKPKGIDPRFVLAIMKQESTFRPGIKSPSAARGLLQLVYDTAAKYNERPASQH